MSGKVSGLGWTWTPWLGILLTHLHLFPTFFRSKKVP